MNDNLFGWRARVGIIYPASGLADMEYYHLAPPGVSVHITRTSMADDEGSVTLETMSQLAGGEPFERLAADLATVKPHALCWMCTSGSFSRGPAWDKQLREGLSEHGKCPATTTSTALVTAFQALGVKKVALGTPYEPRLNEKLVQYVEHFGFEVSNQIGLNLTTDWEIGNLDYAALRDLVRRANTPEAEAIFISDTGIVLSPIAQQLEEDLGKPVFSANMASMWQTLRLAGVREPRPGLGRLFGLVGR
ncbi:MAG: Arylmalonate decarboxylase [Chloroflexi bacterium]|nr:Arylmalonate decarboxylase [Chloroflexota bacterium]